MAEIKAVYKGDLIIGEDVVLLNGNFDIGKTVSKLGGVVKGGKIIGEIKGGNKGDIIKWFNEYAKELEESGKIKEGRKFSFGFSAYSKQDKLKDKNFIKRMAMDFKKKLKKAGINSRWVVSKERNLSSAAVGENKLFMPEGIELNIIDGSESAALPLARGRGHDGAGRIYIGETAAVQDYEKYSELDYGRPARDARAGMLPIKLAKIMVNLSGKEAERTLLDPFCGSGTILQEALFLGYKKIIGSDFSKAAIANTEKNIEWLKKKYPEAVLGKDLSLINISAEKLGGVIKKQSIDAIVTEPYLGPPVRAGVPLDLQGIVKNLSKVYIKAFRQFKEVLKSGGVAVMVFPIFKAEDGFYKFMQIFREIEELGFKKVDLLQPDLMEYAKKAFGKNIISKRNTIIYSREDQYVRREIVKFVRF